MNRPAQLVLLSPLVLLLAGGCQPANTYQPPPPPAVTLSQPVVRTIPVFHEETGRTEAVDQAMVRARVGGILEEFNVQPDDQVKQGVQLFQIEKREYQVKVEAAEAAVTSARAAVDTALAAVTVADAEIAGAQAAVSVTQADFNRLDGLLKQNAIAQSEWDAAEAALETAKAQRQGYDAAKKAAEAEVANARAALDKANADLSQAKLDLEWTSVVSPISGRVTRTLVKRGNLVKPGDDLIEVIQNDPIWVNFNISERFLLQMQREAREAGKPKFSPSNPPDVVVWLKRSDDSGFPYQGKLDYYDPKVDQDTGTLLLRAVFDNGADGELAPLLPGMFVRVRFQIGNEVDAILIPQQAIGRDQVGAYVYVVDSSNRAERRNVTLGTRDEDMVAVTSGLAAGDSIVVSGLQRVRPGAEVDPQQSTAKPAN